MNERKNRGDRSPQRRPAEGVRIIRADEAQAALDAGEAAGRRPDDELRFGDVPPAPQGPRPPHRFPLPDSVDPAGAVPLPPLASSPRSQDTADATPGGRVEYQAALWGGQPAAAPAAASTPDEMEIGERTAELEPPADAIEAQPAVPGMTSAASAQPGSLRRIPDPFRRNPVWHPVPQRWPVLATEPGPPGRPP